MWGKRKPAEGETTLYFATDLHASEVCFRKFVAAAAFYRADLLVAPVLNPGETKRKVYLPASVMWTDAWTGKKLKGGQTITAAAPLEKIPLYLRAGRELPIRS